MQDKFSTKLGAVLAAAAGAVGLGNIWKFPYMVGSHGGGAFLLTYLICICLFGMPLMMSELMIGKQSGQGAAKAFKTLCGSNRWSWLGFVMFITCMCLCTFYFVVTGWCLYYCFEAICGHLLGLDNASLQNFFASFVNEGWKMALFGVITLMFTAAVLWRGIKKGVEAICKYMIPALLVIMVVLIVFVLMLPGSSDGLHFFFKPEFGKITPRLVLAAMGQCFFSLSIGAGALLTYGAYMPKQQNITIGSMQIISLDTLVAILAGIVIFPAVFALGFNPTEGPQLVFVVLPAVFSQMSLPYLMCLLFFFLLSIAALTTTISMMEMPVSFMMESKGWSRRKSVSLIAAILLVLIVLCAFSTSGRYEWLKIAGFNMFEVLDHITSCFLLPLVAFCVSIFLGWFAPKETIHEQLKNDRGVLSWYYYVFLALIRFFIPLVILLIFLNGLGLYQL